LREPKFALNYLCARYRNLFNHIDGPMRSMARRLKSDRFADEIMTIEASVPA
jgi:sulfatase maturation enzyme AslB (radical SAM superfamily)